VNKLEIDYSEIQQPSQVGGTRDDWEAPPRKYFGKKLENGKTEKEPVYVHQEYPRLMYAERNGKITARIVKTEAERIGLGEGWETTPAAFGYIGAPSFDEALMLKDQAEKAAKAKAEADQVAQAEAVVAVLDAPRRGRPPAVK
jgi:hypothetical protein